MIGMKLKKGIIISSNAINEEQAFVGFRNMENMIEMDITRWGM